MKKEMTSRERVVSAIEFKCPDRLPHRHSYLPSVFSRYPELKEILIQQYPSDFAGEEDIFIDKRIYSKGQWTDEWNCEWTVLEDGFLGQVTRNPLENIDALKNYSWPDASCVDLSRESQICKNRGDRYVLIGWLTFFERMIDLRGFENLMVDIAEGSPEFFKIRDKVVDFNLNLIDRLLELNPDAISMADDWGSQLSLMINPMAWRKLFLPCYKRIFGRIHEAEKHVFLHTDGVTIDILPDMVDAGVNVFWADMTVNPLQKLREQLGGKVCFQAMPDVQFIMKEGTPADVEKHAKNIIKTFNDFNGGLIACSELEPDQSWENIKTILETFNHYGKYPMELD